jgi:starvation-inducible outer membrane lipoprotein
LRVHRHKVLIFVLGWTLCLSACITSPRPIEDYALARAAIEAAKSVDSARHSPGYWSQAEESFRRGKVLYNEREFDAAKEEFINARLAAERAENSARLIRQRNGEVL